MQSQHQQQAAKEQPEQCSAEQRARKKESQPNIVTIIWVTSLIYSTERFPFSFFLLLPSSSPIALAAFLAFFVFISLPLGLCCTFFCSVLLLLLLLSLLFLVSSHKICYIFFLWLSVSPLSFYPPQPIPFNIKTDEPPAQTIHKFARYHSVWPRPWLLVCGSHK